MTRKSSTKAAPKSRARRLVLPAPGLLLVLAILGLFVFHATLCAFTQDDAYISLRYAQNFAEGNGLVFNPGERVEGYSNFSWTLLLAVFYSLGAPPVLTATWLGILFGVLAIFFAAKLARNLEGGWGPASVITALIVAGNSAFALWSTGGLETALFAFLVTAGLERGYAPGLSPRARLAAPILFLLAAVTRPDGPLIFAAWFGLRALDTVWLKGPSAHPNGVRGLATELAVFVGPLLPYAAWKLSYYGELLPNTYYAKAGLSATYVSRGIKYAREFFDGFGLWGLAPLLAVLSLLREKFSGVEARLLAIWIAYGLYLVIIGGDVLYMHRFWLPVLPLGAVLMARGLTWGASRFASGRGAPVVATALALLMVGTMLTRNWEPVQGRRMQEIGFVHNMTETALWLKEALPRGSTVAATTIGAIAYYSEHRVLDMLGLTDYEVAHHPKMIDGLTDTWREIKYNAESVLLRRPDAILFSTGIRPSSAAEKALFLYETFYETYYHYFFMSTPRRINTQVVFRVRDDAPPPHATRLDLDDFEFLNEYGFGLRVLSNERDYGKAAEHFKKSIELAGGDFFWGRVALGCALFDSDQPGGVELLSEIVAEDPWALEAQVRVGEHLLIRGEVDAAGQIFSQARRADPHDPISWMGSARVEYLRGNWEKSFEFASQANRICGTNAQYLTTLGNWRFGPDAWSLPKLPLGTPESSIRRRTSRPRGSIWSGRFVPAR